jgi:hypothetical protein
MRRLVAAEWRMRRRTVAALAGGAFLFLFVVGATYQAFGGPGLSDQLFGGRPPRAVAAFSGSREGNIFVPRHYLAFGFNHPLFLVLTLAVAVSIGSGSVAADVETGRAELLYVRPVPRTRILLARLALWAPAQLVVVAGALAGSQAGALLAPDLRAAGPLRVGWVAFQYLPLASVVAGAAFAASARARTRSGAMAATVGLVTAAWLLNFVSLVWSPLDAARWATPFGYYEPLVVADEGPAWWKAGILVSLATVLFADAVRNLSRRDLV